MMLPLNDIKYNILWLSDIHYTNFDKQENNSLHLYDFLDSFFKTCKQIKRELNKNQQKIDFIIITGDIAQSGEINEYELFKKDILSPLFNIFKNAELLIIPGNHDVSRDKIEYFESYFDENQYEISNLDFLKNNPDIENVFQNYTNSFKNYDFIPKEASNKYREKLYHGFYHCTSKDTFFTMLNSSWLSFGEESLKYYIENKLNSDKETREIVKDISNRVNEYGNQFVGLNIFQEIEILKNHITNFNDHIYITAIHHPTNWLNWTERIDYDGTEDGFFYLKNNTDILLCGHEHAPKNYFAEYYNNEQSLVILSGSFIEYKYDKVEKLSYPDFDNSTFNVLSINSTKRNVIQKKYFFDTTVKKWKNDENYSRQYKLKKNYSSRLTPEKYNETIKAIINTSDNTSNLSEFLNKKIKKQDNYYFTEDEIIFLIKSKEDWNLNTLKPSLIKALAIVKKIRFVCFDILFDYETQYQNTNDKLSVLNKIKEGIEFDFNNMRYDFFSNLEKNDAHNFADSIFICSIIPYWKNNLKLTL